MQEILIVILETFKSVNISKKNNHGENTFRYIVFIPVVIIYEIKLLFLFAFLLTAALPSIYSEEYLLNSDI